MSAELRSAVIRDTDSSRGSSHLKRARAIWSFPVRFEPTGVGVSCTRVGNVNVAFVPHDKPPPLALLLLFLCSASQPRSSNQHIFVKSLEKKTTNWFFGACFWFLYRIVGHFCLNWVRSDHCLSSSWRKTWMVADICDVPPSTPNTLQMD